jgi:hypothetical protein
MYYNGAAEAIVLIIIIHYYPIKAVSIHAGVK